MQSALSLSFSQASLTTPNLPISSSNVAPRNLRLCGLRREAFGFSTPKQLTSCRFQTRSNRIEVSAAAGNGAPSDYDLVIIGAGVGGHGAALHAFQRFSADKVEPQEGTSEARALITKLTEEKQSAIQLNNKLQRELEQLRRDSKRSQSGIPLMYVLLFGLIGLILGYIMKST